jgi:hypothetical protein
VEVALDHRTVVKSAGAAVDRGRGNASCGQGEKNRVRAMLGDEENKRASTGEPSSSDASAVSRHPEPRTPHNTQPHQSANILPWTAPMRSVPLWMYHPQARL